MDLNYYSQLLMYINRFYWMYDYFVEILLYTVWLKAVLYYKQYIRVSCICILYD